MVFKPSPKAQPSRSKRMGRTSARVNDNSSVWHGFWWLPSASGRKNESRSSANQSLATMWRKEPDWTDLFKKHKLDTSNLIRKHSIQDKPLPMHPFFLENSKNPPTSQAHRLRGGSSAAAPDPSLRRADGGLRPAHGRVDPRDLVAWLGEGPMGCSGWLGRRW